MTREEIIRNLKYTMEKHKNDTVHTFDTNISVMCKDILDYLEQEPKIGHWIKSISENGITSAVHCSKCGFEDDRYMLFKYCPNCGIKMEKNNFELSLKVLGVNNGKILLETSNGRLMYLSGINIEKTNEKLIENEMKSMQNVVVQESEEQKDIDRKECKYHLKVK